MHFSDFQLSAPLLNTLSEIGFQTPTPIQELAIPKVIEGRDLIASAQTGTGKTAAFLLPALHNLSQAPKTKGRGAEILILVPTRELAIQVAQEAKKFSKHLPQLKTVCIYGGVPYPPQNKMLSQPYDILIATPGRLLDHMQEGRISLSRVKLLVLDEADRMLDMGFIAPVEKIAESTAPNRQTLLFSATLDPKIIRISKKLQKDPFEVKIAPEQTVNSRIEQRLYFTDSFQHKLRLLEHILVNASIDQAIVFTATKRQASDISMQLQEKGLKAGSLHGNMNQRQRSKTLDRLRRKQIQILVATDVAARGIDVATLSHVINIDLPYQLEDYVHRIGRTARAGASGIAITFISYAEQRIIDKIEKTTGSNVEVHTIEGLEPKPFQRNDRSQQRPSDRPGRKPFGRPGRRNSEPRGSRFDETTSNERGFGRRNSEPKASRFDETSFNEKGFGKRHSEPRTSRFSEISSDQRGPGKKSPFSPKKGPKKPFRNKSHFSKSRFRGDY